MATLVTVTCDRCGAIIPKGAKNGGISATLDAPSYESLVRSMWELCESCFDHVLGRIGDIAGEPAEKWVRPEAGLKDEDRFPDKAEALRVLELTRAMALADAGEGAE